MNTFSIYGLPFSCLRGVFNKQKYSILMYSNITIFSVMKNTLCVFLDMSFCPKFVKIFPYCFPEALLFCLSIAYLEVILLRQHSSCIFPQVDGQLTAPSLEKCVLHSTFCGCFLFCSIFLSLPQQHT